MNTRLTVGDARAQLYQEVCPGNASDPKFLRYLNEVCERFIWSGKWKGALVHTIFDSAAGFISLPPEFYSVLAMRYDKWPGSAIASQYVQYMEFGTGEVDDTLAWTGVLFDRGDGFPSTSDIVLPGRLRVRGEATDDGSILRVFGLDLDGREVFDAAGVPGEQVTFNAPFATTTTSFSVLTGVQKTSSNGYLSLHVVPDDLSAEYRISVYQPSETRPMYRRYQTGVAERAIKVLCQRRFILMENETDWVIPGNLSALRYGLKMRFFEDAQDMANAQNCFDMAINFLNQEAKASRGGVRPDMLVNPFGDGIAFPWAN